MRSEAMYIPVRRFALLLFISSTVLPGDRVPKFFR
jgi:hypothetical protein